MGAAITVLAIFAGASFFFALAETALFALGKWQVRQIEATRTGKLVSNLLGRSQDLLATLVLGNSFANAGIVAVMFWVAINHHWSVAWTLVGVLFWILLGCEVVPKTLAVRASETWARRVAPPMLVLQTLSKPFRHSAQLLTNFILKAAVPTSVQRPAQLSDDEYQELLEMAFQQGALAASEKEIILQIVGLDRRQAKDVMKPRSQMTSIADDLSVPEMIAAAKKFKHRRLPMYDESPDTIVGVLNTRALLLDPEVDLSIAIEFPSFVPETMNLLQLLKALQRQQRGLAIVLDEFGGTAG
ncbi:MAG: CNNM domain-containing protein, partial [Limisphaerales bacterium]